MPWERVHPPGTTVAERLKISSENLKKAGGARKTFRLTPEAMSALNKIKASRPNLNDTEIVCDAIIKLANRLK